MTNFTHLHLHSDRSSLDSTIKIPDLVNHVRELGMDSVAITDHGVVTGAVTFYEECLKEKNSDGEPVTPIKPIIGMEAYISPTSDHTLREPLEEHPKQQSYHLTLLAKNAEGVKELYELSSRGFLEGFYYKPRVSLEMIESVGKNLIVLTACIKGPISWQFYEKHNKEAANNWAAQLKEMFDGRLWIEIMDHSMPDQVNVNKMLHKISKEFSIPMVATNDSHFLKREDHYEHQIMMCMQLSQPLRELTMTYPEECYVKSPNEMIDIHGQELCEETQRITEMIDIQLDLKSFYFPEFKIDY